LSIAVEGIPASYGAHSTAETEKLPAHFLCPEVHQEFDFSDVFAALAAFEPIRAAYDRGKASHALAVKVAPLDAPVPKVMEE